MLVELPLRYKMHPVSLSKPVTLKNIKNKQQKINFLSMYKKLCIATLIPPKLIDNTLSGTTRLPRLALHKKLYKANRSKENPR